MTDKKAAVNDVELSESVAGSGVPLRRWSTTRVELWAFYVYYVVSGGFLFAVGFGFLDLTQN